MNIITRYWQDLGRTIPAVADGDPVMAAEQIHVGADGNEMPAYTLRAPSRSQAPTIRGGLPCFDGVDDVLAPA